MDNQHLNQEIGKKIALQRQKAGMTQDAVAEVLGAISRLERGTVAASVPRLMELAALFGCQTGDFFLENSTLPSDQAVEISQLLNRISPEGQKICAGTTAPQCDLYRTTGKTNILIIW